MIKDDWLRAACDYVPGWIKFQTQDWEPVGCTIAIVHRGKTIKQFGVRLSERHRFRIASHSKAFTAAGIMKLREKNKLGLSDTVGRYVKNLNKQISSVTIEQLLSHRARLSRDGSDDGYFEGRLDFPDETELIQILRKPPISGQGFKYSNIGFALLGLVIKRVTDEEYATWIKKTIIDGANLKETYVDAPKPMVEPFAHGYSGWRLGEVGVSDRLVIQGDFPTHAMAPAVGFVSTANDLAQFFFQLSPRANKSVLTLASRNEMTQPLYPIWSDDVKPMYYGYGIMSGEVEDWKWFGHDGGLQGYRTRTATLVEQDLTISVLTNAVDGLAGFWLNGIIYILRAFRKNWRWSEKVKVSDWTGRWWSLHETVDLVPMGGKVFVVNPSNGNPFYNAAQIKVAKTKRPKVGEIVWDEGFGHSKEIVIYRKVGEVEELWLGPSRRLRNGIFERDLERRMKRTPSIGSP